MLRTITTLFLMLACLIMSLASAMASELSPRAILQVEQAVDRVIVRILPKLNQENIVSIISKIETIKKTSRLTQKTTYLLDYLRLTLTNLLEPVIITPTTTGSTSTTLPSAISNNLSYTHGPKTILAGKESPIVAKYELVTLYEDIMVKDFVISSSNNLDEVIESVQVYNASGVKIAQGTPTQHQVLFNNQDIRLSQGSHQRYMTITPRKIGYNNASLSNISYQLTLAITRALGVTSTNQVTIITTNQISDSITIRPFLFTTAELTKNRNGNSTDPLLNNGNTKVAILRLGIDTHDNTNTNNQTLKVILSEISLSLRNNIAGTIDSITLRNSNGGTSIQGIINNGKVVFPLTAMPIGERTLESLSEQGFLIHLNATLSPNISESISVSIDNNSISFTTNEDNTLYSDLGLGGGFSSSVSVRE